MARANAAAASGRGSYWQDLVLVRVVVAELDLKRVAHDEKLEESAVGCIQQLLTSARQAALSGNRLGNRAIGRAFANLHTAEVMIAKHAPADELTERLVAAMARLRSVMSPAEPRRRDLEARLRSGKASVSVRRSVLVAALDWSYAAADAKYARLRSFRNIVFAVAGALAVVAVLIGLVDVWRPGALSICFEGSEGTQVCPTGNTPNSGDVFLIELLGALGGTLAAVLAITQLKGTQTPYSVPLSLAVLKLPLGAVSALAGLLLVHGAFVPGLSDLDSSGQIIAYAVFLGVAQQLVTAFIDKRGQELLEEVPSRQGPQAADRLTELVEDTYVDLDGRRQVHVGSATSSPARKNGA